MDGPQEDICTTAATTTDTTELFLNRVVLLVLLMTAALIYKSIQKKFCQAWYNKLVKSASGYFSCTLQQTHSTTA